MSLTSQELGCTAWFRGQPTSVTNWLIADLYYHHKYDHLEDIKLCFKSTAIIKGLIYMRGRYNHRIYILLKHSVDSRSTFFTRSIILVYPKEKSELDLVLYTVTALTAVHINNYKHDQTQANNQYNHGRTNCDRAVIIYYIS